MVLFKRTSFKRANLEGVNFAKARLKEAILAQAYLKGADFGGFSKAYTRSKSMEHCIFERWEILSGEYN